MRTTDTSVNPVIWPQIVMPYIKNEDLLVAPGSDGTPAKDWNTRRTQSVGYSDATGVDPNSTAVPGNAAPGTEGFTSAANFAIAEEAARTGLFAVTPNGPKGDTTSKARGYVFNPYNGKNSPDNDYYKGLPMISDRDLIKETGDVNYPTSPSLAAGALKPIYARYMADKQGNGSSPIVFADGHAKSYSAKSMNAFGTIIWRFR
jgi:prepilin-type processing-associated H-X9-DG protein